MNKLIVIPLFIMVIMAIFGINMALADNPNTGDDVSGVGYIIQGDNGRFEFYYENEYIGFFSDTYDNQHFDPRSAPNEPFRLIYPSWSYDQYTNLADFNSDWGTTISKDTSSTIIDITDTTILWGAIVAILAATVAFGVKVFGSGLSEFSQRTLYLSLAWGALWAFLSITSYEILSDDSLGIFGGLVYFGLTFMYIIGIMLEATSA